MTRSKPWLKLWTDWVHDPKLISQTLAERGAWSLLLSLAQECAADGYIVKGNGAPMSIEDMANCLHLTKAGDYNAFTSMLSKMEAQGSLSWNGNCLFINNFAERQAQVASETQEAVRERQQRRRAKLKEEYGIVDSTIPLENRISVIDRDQSKCRHCGKPGVRPSPQSSVVIDPDDDTPFEFDHAIPRSKGGSDDIDNLLLSCRKCNRARGTKELSRDFCDNSDSPLTTPSLKERFVTEEEGEGEEIRDVSVTNLLQTSPSSLSREHLAPKNSSASLIFSYWISQKIMNHKVLTPKMVAAIKSLLKNYNQQEICQAITNYAEIVHGAEYRWSYKWTLEDFLHRGLEKFMDGEVARSNYRIDAGGDHERKKAGGGRADAHRRSTEAPTRAEYRASIKK